MSKIGQRFIEDRALRDAARKVFMADLAHAKSSLSGAGLASRVAGRVGDGAKDVLEVAKVHADDNRGVLAGLTGALLLWIAREPILEILGLAPDLGDDGAGHATDIDLGEEALDETAEPPLPLQDTPDDNPGSTMDAQSDLSPGDDND
jgi:hypothetical protein